MSLKFNLTFLVRIISFSMICILTGLYIPEFLPVYLLPLISICIILLSYFYEEINIKFIPSIILSILFFFVTVRFIFFGLSLSHSSFTDRIFLHLALSLWIIYILCFFSFLSTILFIRSNKWKKFEPLLLITIVCILFWSQGNHSLTLFPHPLQASIFILFFILIQLFQLIFNSHFPARSVSTLFIFIPFCLALVIIIINSFNTLSVSNNGGLIQPTLFRFDFSPYLTLQNEIKINDKLVLIVRTKEENTQNLLRRIYLSGWDAKKGFYEKDAPGEYTQPKTVPSRRTELPHSKVLNRNVTEQEFFIVNFDPTSLIAMDYPIVINPYKLWNESTFNSAYSVTSECPNFMPFELLESIAPSGKASEGLSNTQLTFYTTIDTKTKITLQKLAESITADTPNYYDKILLLTSYLRDGDFRYSLKPGIAPDGDQLSYFLFTSKKGYCTYFAFSLCLMLRSIGIPARVAAGFFIQPNSGALDYYPIRSNMAHAWVEVFFPKYGWISFDPTTTQIAEGEDLNFTNNAGGDEFTNLLNEIIDKRMLLSQKQDDINDLSHLNSISSFINSIFLRINHAILYLILIFILFILMLFIFYDSLIIKFSRNNRLIIFLISKKIYRFLYKAGFKRKPNQNRHEFILFLNNQDLSSFFSLEQKARYSPTCDQNDSEQAKLLLKRIKGQFKIKRLLFLFCFSFLLINPFYNLTIYSEENTKESAQDLLSRAQTFISMENWEQAITLLTNGVRLFPNDPSFHYKLGELYYDKALYEPSYKEFLTAKNLGYSGKEIFSHLSETSSYLNKDEEALLYLRNFLDSSPNDLFAWSDFGWLCYKTHRLDEGIDTLLNISKTYGPDSNIFVNLGNLYTAAFNYNEAKKYFTLAINFAENRNEPYLLSIYYYNRSILEELFYNFEEAYDDTHKSLQASERSSGYLMQGELELRRLNYSNAFKQYLKAFSLDSTPLATLGLADTLAQAGYVDEAQRYINSVTNRGDISWISNYGTTVDQFKADLHAIQTDLYQFLLNKEKRKIVHNLSSLVQKQWNLIKYQTYYWYYDGLNRIQNKNVAHRYELKEKNYNKVNGQELYINSFYFLAFDKWKNTAIPYLSRSRKFETILIPKAIPSYLYEEGSLKKNLPLLDQAIEALDPIWERKYIEQAVAKRILLTSSHETGIKMKYIEQLFLINPASFLFYDIQLPVTFTYTNTTKNISKKEFTRIKKQLLKVGFSENKQAPFIIDIKEDSETFEVSLQNRTGLTRFYTQVFNRDKELKPNLGKFINNFSTGVFKTDLGI